MSFVNPKHVSDELRHNGISEEFLAVHSDLSQTAVNRWLRGGLKLSIAAQFRISETLHCILQLIESSETPINFRRVSDLKPALDRFRAQMSAEDAACIKREIEERGEAADAGRGA